jgi:hypothetical protein
VPVLLVELPHAASDKAVDAASTIATAFLFILSSFWESPLSGFPSDMCTTVFRSPAAPLRVARVTFHPEMMIALPAGIRQYVFH